MKKTLAMLAAVTFLLSGCNSQQVKDEVKDEIRDVQEDISEVIPPSGGTGAPSQETAAPPSGGDVDTSQFIGEEKAKEIALKQAGLTADAVVFEKVKLEKDDGVWEYEVDFRKDRTEYDAEISAIDGTVIAWDVDND